MWNRGQVALLACFFKLAVRREFLRVRLAFLQIRSWLGFEAGYCLGVYTIATFTLDTRVLFLV